MCAWQNKMMHKNLNEDPNTNQNGAIKNACVSLFQMCTQQYNSLLVIEKSALKTKQMMSKKKN